MLPQIIILFLLVYPFQSVSTAVVYGNDTTAPFGFTKKINATAYDDRMNVYYVGLDLGAAEFAISRTDQRPNTQVPRFIAIGSSNLINDQSVVLLALGRQTNTFAVVGALLAPFGSTPNFLVLPGFNGNNPISTGSLNDAAGATTSGIIDIVGSQSFFFPAVRPNGGNFGNANSGIGLVGFVLNNNTNTVTVDVKDAQTGSSGNFAVPLDLNSPQLGTTPVTFQGGILLNRVSMLWSERLQRLYTGVFITSGGVATDYAKAVVVGRIGSGGELILEAIAPDSAITAAADEIIVTQGANESISPLFLETLHASTGPDYLIVNGGRHPVADNPIGNTVFALPLVNNPADPTTHGTLANKNGPLVNGSFVLPATAMGELPLATDRAARVGAGTIPIEPNQQISELVVAADAVYVVLDTSANASNDSGLLYSQALFDAQGKIIEWTPWTKRAVPFNAFEGIALPGNLTHNGPLIDASINQNTGNIFVIDGLTERVVGLTQWNTGVLTNSLPSTLRRTLPDGSFSFLDLDQATRGFLNNTTGRYALFGGAGKVVFTRISIGNNIASLTGPQTVITDFSSPENVLITRLPNNSTECVQVLEYSRALTTDGNANFFFAGTQDGLYAFAQNSGQGFNVNQLSTVNQPPFIGGGWVKIPTITGSIIDLKTSGAGDRLYILTRSVGTTTPLQNTLYSVPFTTNINTMFAVGNIRTIAQTGTGIFANQLAFYGIQIIATDNPSGGTPEDKEQLVLATNNGLFVSNTSQNPGNGIPDATNQTTANWQLVAEGEHIAFSGISGVSTPVQHTTWPISITSLLNGCKTFGRSSLYQFSGAGNSTGTEAVFNGFVPSQFNASPINGFETLDPIRYFFTDGGRRFFIFRRLLESANSTPIGVLPYFIGDFAQKTLQFVFTPTAQQQINWISTIGDSGYLLAGTNDGVIALS